MLPVNPDLTSNLTFVVLNWDGYVLRAIIDVGPVSSGNPDLVAYRDDPFGLPYALNHL